MPLRSAQNLSRNGFASPARFLPPTLLEAERDRADIWDYIAAESPGAAVRLDALFSDAAARLATHPKLGKAGKVAGTRELIPHESYRLVYEIEQETVWLLALVHTARQWPPARA